MPARRIGWLSVASIHGSTERALKELDFLERGGETEVASIHGSTERALKELQA